MVSTGSAVGQMFSEFFLMSTGR